MNLKNAIIENDTNEIINSKFINWTELEGKTILVTGATGLIGSKLVEAFVCADKKIKVIALARSRQRLENLFAKELTDNKIIPHYQDITQEISYPDNVDYIIHTACGTNSDDFINTPVETIDTIINGTKNILNFAKNKNVKSIVHLSSMEVYGETDFQRENSLKEEDLGYIDIHNIRSCYPESKRLAETLCVSFAKEYQIPVKIARLVQITAANASPQDKRVINYFAQCVVNKSAITLQSNGESSRNFCYITDCISGILTILVKGKNGVCYNVANKNAFSSIIDLAKNLTEKYNIPPININIDKTGKYPPASKLKVDSSRLEELNWHALVNLDEMFERIIASFNSQR